MSLSSSLPDRVRDDLKEAMRQKDKPRLRTLRSLRSALKNAEIERRGKGDDGSLSKQEQLTVLRKEVNQRRESIEQYEEAGREDLVEREREELHVLETYMPDPLSDDELEERLREIIDGIGAESMADMGPVMGRAMSALRGRVDGDRVRTRVQSLLQK